MSLPCGVPENSRYHVPCTLALHLYVICGPPDRWSMIEHLSPMERCLQTGLILDAKWAEELKLRYNVTLVTPHKKLLYEKVPSGDTFSCVSQSNPCSTGSMSKLGFKMPFGFVPCRACFSISFLLWPSPAGVLLSTIDSRPQGE